MSGAYLDLAEGWMSGPELDTIRRLAASVKHLGVFLELGVWKGLSTSALTLEGPTICVDTFLGTPGEPCEGEDTSERFRQNLESLGRRNFIVLRCRTSHAFATLAGTPVSLALVDADHSYPEALHDYRGAWSLLVPGGILIADDLHRRDTSLAWSHFLSDVHLRPENGEGKLAWVVKP